MFILLIYFPEQTSYPLRYTRFKDIVALKEEKSMKDKGGNHKQRLNESTEKMEIDVTNKSSHFRFFVSTPLTRSLAHVDDDVLSNLLKIEPTRLKKGEIVQPRRILKL